MVDNSPARAPQVIDLGDRLPASNLVTFRLLEHEALSDGLARIAAELTGTAVHGLSAPIPLESRDAVVHESRKQVKKLRSILKLVRSEIGEEAYRLENTRLRDASRRLAPLRETRVMVETLDLLTDYYSQQLAHDAFDEYRSYLLFRHRDVVRRFHDQEGVLEAVALTMKDVGANVVGWPVEGDDFAIVKPGLEGVYHRGRKWMKRAYGLGTEEAFHEWRKHVKSLWYQLRILEPIWSAGMRPVVESLGVLQEGLGDANDLAELRLSVDRAPELLDGRRAFEALSALTSERVVRLRKAARPLGARVYCEKPSAFVDRIGAYWEIWRSF